MCLSCSEGDDVFIDDPILNDGYCNECPGVSSTGNAPQPNKYFPYYLLSYASPFFAEQSFFLA
jgi:hypothetical protein